MRAIPLDISDGGGRPAPLVPSAPLLPPDLIPEAERRELNQERDLSYSHEVSEADRLHTPTPAPVSSPSEPSSPKKRRKGWTFKRSLCCLGWIFCFPVYCACWALREPPIDREDFEEDDCYPCFS